MKQVGVLTGRHYDLFEYSGHPEAERVIVQMGSAAQTTEQTVKAMNERGECSLYYISLSPWKIIGALALSVLGLSTKKPTSFGMQYGSHFLLFERRDFEFHFSSL